LNLFLATNDAAQPLYYEASVGLSKVVENTLPQIANFDAQGGRFGNALEAASYCGDKKVVQMLPDTRGDQYSRRKVWQCTASGIT
jgi:hypothetical protein